MTIWTPKNAYTILYCNCYKDVSLKISFYFFILYSIILIKLNYSFFPKDLFIWQSEFWLHILVSNSAFLEENKFHFCNSGETNQIYKNACTREWLLEYSKSNFAMSNNYFPLFDNWNDIHVIFNQNLPERWWEIHLLIYQIHLYLSLKVKDLSTEPEIPLLFKKPVLSSNTVLTKSILPSSTALITSDKKNPNWH